MCIWNNIVRGLQNQLRALNYRPPALFKVFLILRHCLYVVLKVSTTGAGETAQELSTCFALTGNPGSVLGTHMVAHNHLKLQFQGIQHPTLTSSGIRQAHDFTHAGKTFIDINQSKKLKKKKRVQMADYFKEIQPECFSSYFPNNSKHCNLNKNRSLNNNQFSLYSEFIYLQICLLIEVQTPIYGHPHRCRAAPNSCQRAAQPHLQQTSRDTPPCLSSHREPLLFPASFSAAILSFKKAVMDLKKKLVIVLFSYYYYSWP